MKPFIIFLVFFIGVTFSHNYAQDNYTITHPQRTFIQGNTENESGHLLQKIRINSKILKVEFNSILKAKRIKRSDFTNHDFHNDKNFNDISELPSGIYFYKLQVGDFIQTKKMVLLK